MGQAVVRVQDLLPPSLENVSWTGTGSAGGTGTASATGALDDYPNLPTLGAKMRYEVTATVSSTATGTIENVVTLTPNWPPELFDPDGSNDSATASFDIIEADLSISLGGGATALPGDTLTYTVVASNSGPKDVAGATVVVVFPAGLTATWTAVVAGGASAASGGSGNLDESVDLPADSSVTYTVVAAIAPTATGALLTTASISSSMADPNPANNSATTSTSLAPRLSVTPPRPFPSTRIGKGSPARFIQLANTGGSDVTGLRFTVSGPGRRDFRVLNPSVGTLGAGASTQAKATFRPRKKGRRSAVVTILSNVDPAAVPLKGVGRPLPARR